MKDIDTIIYIFLGFLSLLSYNLLYINIFYSDEIIIKNIEIERLKNIINDKLITENRSTTLKMNDFEWFTIIFYTIITFLIIYFLIQTHCIFKKKLKEKDIEIERLNNIINN